MSLLTGIVINHDAIHELLTGPEIQADLQARAERIAAAAGDGHEVEVSNGKNRARRTVRTATTEARIAEATDQTLTRAIDAGRF